MLKTINKLTLATTLCSTVLLGSQAMASEFGSKHQRPHTFTDYARVVNVEPVYRQVEHQRPVQQCGTNYQHSTQNEFNYNDHELDQPTQHRRHNTGQTIIGGLVGGVIGNKIGSHSAGKKGRIGGTIAGAIIGSAIANEQPKRHRRNKNSRHRRPQSVTRPVQHCTTHVETYYEQVLKFYAVTYRYHGQQYKTRMKRDPGSRIPVQISVQPLRG